ncbi:YitT family protein [Lacinutrix sp. C3R15]|uniref:YitT family protein n=1 Tax=Flavobacteriaceae TaxID=49546 RepID=UPI001C09076F|nr:MULTISPECIES: YitT family protein [Flavobacteriaceae]MBU2939680.1 YitT family protein [Lacinutrix sp. C3R15]MDO6622995.1 YitT family protein [Oceanihabitans sp. 1_MG-2023]
MNNSKSNTINLTNILSLKSLLWKIFGVVFAVIAIKGFMIPNHFLDGGLLGISILIHEFYHINVGIPLILLNIPFVILSYKKIGKNFAIHSLLSLFFLGIFLSVLPVPAVTHDHFLTAAFGGVFVGLGIGFVIRGGGVIDGLEVLADFTHKEFGLSTSEIIIAINTVVFLVIALYLGIEKAMYSILTFFTAVKVSDYVVDGFEKLISLTIISPNPEIIKKLIVNDFNKAITVYKGERGNLPGSYGIKHDCDIVVTVVTRLEVHKIKKAIKRIDPKAFMFVLNIKEVGGGITSKKKHH